VSPRHGRKLRRRADAATRRAIAVITRAAIAATIARLGFRPQSYEGEVSSWRGLCLHGGSARRRYDSTAELLSTRPTTRICCWRADEAMLGRTLVGVRGRSGGSDHALPEYGDAWAAFGDLYLWSGRPADAIQAYTRWVSVQPNEPAAYLARSKAYRSSADRTAARADLEKARAERRDRRGG